MTDGTTTAGQKATAGQRPRATLIVTPRERFGVAKESLESIYAATDEPFDLVYVDGAGPTDLGEWIGAMAAEHGFRHIRTDRFLSPNEARNIGIKASTTDYVVFIDNDVIVAPGWLSRLVQTADESGADVVAPLTCQGLPLHQEIHQAGAIVTEDLDSFLATPPGKRIMRETMFLQGQPVSAAPPEAVETQCCEFHCALARRSVFDRVGLLDEEMLATKEHVDFCLAVLSTGGKVLLEPRSIVTYLFPNRARPITPDDREYFLVRWSDDWQLRSLDRLAEKWGLVPDQPYLSDRRRSTHWRYNEGLVKPMVRKLPMTDKSEFLRKAARRVIAEAIAIRGAALTQSVNRQMQDEARQRTRQPQ